MSRYQPLQPLISNDEQEVVVYAADNFSQYPTRNASVSSRCDRALVAASHRDVVVLRGELDQEFHRWLRSLELSTDHIVEYKQPATGRTLSELVLDNPLPIQNMVRKLGRSPVYVPWFSTRFEAKAAESIDAKLFGATETETLRYNDKAGFKELCQTLNIPVVEGDTLPIRANDSANFSELEALVDLYRTKHKTVIIRGTLGVSAMSLYKTQGGALSDLYRQIVASGEPIVLVEPFLEVFSSPNDQWAIDRDGAITHIGMFEQVCKQGMIHVGNLKGVGPFGATYDTIKHASLKVVTRMAETGYCGIIGIDYIVSNEGIFPVENNARFNGSSYVHLLVEHLEQKVGAIPCWKFIKLNIPPCSFASLADRLSPVIYDGERTNSVFPLNCDELSLTGVFALVVLAQNIEYLDSLQRELTALGLGS